MNTRKASGAGYFISLEGIEGVGKSTVINFITEFLEQKKIPYVLTREPGGTPIAEDIRKILLSHHDDEVMCSETELLLMFAGRIQNVTQVILPALKQGKWVISDRFTDASFAYQGGGRGIPNAKIAALSDGLLQNFEPDLTLLLDIPVGTSVERVLSRGVKDRIEIEDIQFFERVREYYLQLAKKHSHRFRLIDASAELQIVKKEVLHVISALLDPQP
jgi:dTMP kinase